MAIDYRKKTKLELRQVAQDILDEKIFTDRQVETEHRGLIPSIFLGLSLMNEEQLREFKQFPLGMIYGYYTKTGPKNVNDYPMFEEFHILDEDDTAKMLEYFEALKRRD